MLRRNLILIGPMGAGKSTIGKMLAKKYKLDFVDIDSDIVKQAGAAIPLIFEYEGESGFRQRETNVLESRLQEASQVIATGGGAILAEQNRKLMRTHGVVIFLNASVDTQFHRTKKDINRPLLQDKNPRAKLEQLFKIREPIYLELADFVIDANRSSARFVIEDIDQQLRKINYF